MSPWLSSGDNPYQSPVICYRLDFDKPRYGNVLHYSIKSSKHCLMSTASILSTDIVSGFHSASVRLSHLICIANNWSLMLPGNRKVGTEVGLSVSCRIPIYAWFHIVPPITWCGEEGREGILLTCSVVRILP